MTAIAMEGKVFYLGKAPPITPPGAVWLLVKVDQIPPTMRGEWVYEQGQWRKDSQT
jgi:hypothetical protein